MREWLRLKRGAALDTYEQVRTALDGDGLYLELPPTEKGKAAAARIYNALCTKPRENAIPSDELARYNAHLFNEESKNLQSEIHELATRFPGRELQVVEVGGYPGAVKKALLSELADLKIRITTTGVHKREKPDVVAQAHMLPFQNNSVHFVYTNWSTPWFPDRTKFLEEVSRVLAPGGKAIIHFEWNAPAYVMREYPPGKEWLAEVYGPRTNDFFYYHGKEGTLADLLLTPEFQDKVNRAGFELKVNNTSYKGKQHKAIELIKKSSGRINLGLKLKHILLSRLVFNLPENAEQGFRLVYARRGKQAMK